jgi:hypothetical protein
MSDLLHIWTIYDSPADAPGMFVVRRFEIHTDHAKATLDARYSGDIGVLRDLMRRKGLHCVGRCEEDEPQVVESWL